MSTISSTLLFTFQPRIISYRVEGNKERTIQTFSTAMAVYYSVFLIGAIGLVLFGPWILTIIHSNASLPELYILLTYLLVIFLEENHSNFAIFISTGNKIPFVPAALTSGAMICLGDFLSLKFTALGLIGVISVQGLVQLSYNNWKWPKWVLDEYNLTYPVFLKYGARGLSHSLKNVLFNIYNPHKSN